MKYQSILAATLLSASTLAMSTAAHAQTGGNDVEEIVVVGIRSSLQSALLEKRNADSLTEVIIAEDIGKLPDQNLAEVLENITGIQITRSAGVGTGVQIRGTNANRIEINGVSTVGSGAGRSGIDFEDVNASIISAVEVIKSPEAKTVEGSVGGTVNLRTIRPLDLKKPLISARVQLEDSSLSTEDLKPRFSGALGNKWDTGAGEVGFVISGSYTEQEAVSFRPRTDRDVRGSASGAPGEYLGIQFLLQEQENDDYVTTNIASTLEWSPNDELRFYADAILNDQERSRDNYRLQASGVGAYIGRSLPTEFETIDFGLGPDVLTLAALQGTLEPGLTDHDANLRMTGETGSRVTESQVFAIGGEWERDNWSAKVELASTTSDTRNPTLNTTLNFLNPKCPIVGNTRSDNCVPYIYDLRGDSLAFGINTASPYAPTAEDLTNPANVNLARLEVGRDTTENEEKAFRTDFSYDLGDMDLVNSFLTSVDFGFRRNESSSEYNDIGDRFGRNGNFVDTPPGTLFEELLVTGPTNYGDADGRSLFIRDFLLVDPDRSFSDQQGVIDILSAAVVAHDPASPKTIGFDVNERNALASYAISEETNALYAQANFERGIFKGNAGLRYVETEIASTGFNSLTNQNETVTGSYEFVLPRVNMAVTPREDIVLRLGYGKDIRRPDFDDLNVGFDLDDGENDFVQFGNAGLEPEEVTSFDVGAEWYFAPAAVLSVGYFRKSRTNIFGNTSEIAILIPEPLNPGGFRRETDMTCPGGGIFNPEIPNGSGVLGNPAFSGDGLCVGTTTPGNDSTTTTQSGLEFAAQYDLSAFEDKLGWASGFGGIVNYTTQSFSGGSDVDTPSGRGLGILGDISIPVGLLDFSENAYNVTAFYEKYGVSARMRYTWREGFRTEDFGGGANVSGSSTFGFPVHTLDRGQLNASASYDITDQFSVGIEAVNLTEEKIVQKCVSETGPTCFVGYPDRRIVFGGSYTF